MQNWNLEEIIKGRGGVISHFYMQVHFMLRDSCVEKGDGRIAER